MGGRPTFLDEFCTVDIERFKTSIKAATGFDIIHKSNSDVQKEIVH